MLEVKSSEVALFCSITKHITGLEITRLVEKMWIFCPAAQTNHKNAPKPVSSLTKCDKKICYLYKCLSQNRIYSSHTSRLYSIYPNRDIYRTSSAQNNIWSTQLTTVIWKQCRLAPPGGRSTYIYFWIYILKDVLNLPLYNLCVKSGSIKTSFHHILSPISVNFRHILWENQLETSNMMLSSTWPSVFCAQTYSEHKYKSTFEKTMKRKIHITQLKALKSNFSYFKRLKCATTMLMSCILH